ncbi:60.6 kDa protein [Cordyline virus 2]|uniref:60.6 kDa protein n=1 Tax=Cordyline virus 2 TaxID=1177751 RepID=L7P0H0_9CLOS|nr:60.6 kDa protein [Cordyline virus 2]AFJ05050.1 60.6 kDa protein [Cordyline virus 2]
MELGRDTYFLNFLRAVTGKKDVNDLCDDIVNFTLKNDNILRNSSETASSGSGVQKIYKPSYTIRDEKVYINNNNFDKSMYLLLKYLSLGIKNYSDYSSYPPANLNVYYDENLFNRSLENAGLSLPETLLIDDTIGCIFPLSQIRKTFPNHSKSEQEFNYRISNSLGEIFDLRATNHEKLNIFKPKSFYGEKVSDITSSKTLNKAIHYVEVYLEITSKELMNVLFTNLLCFADIVKVKLYNQFGNTGVNNMITLGALFEICKIFEFRKCDLNEKMKFADIYNKEYENTIERLFRKGSIVTNKDIAKYPNATFGEKFSKPSIFSEIVKQYKPSGTRNETHLKLQDVSDDQLMKIFIEYFEKFYSIKDEFLVEAIVLVFFAFMSTSPYIRSRDETFEHKIFIGESEKDLKINPKHFLNFVDSRANRLLPSDTKRNYLRLFCSARSNYAIDLFNHIGYKPTMFPNRNKILDHMRIEFWKGLDMNRLTNSEQMSVNVLKRLTEYHSKRDDQSRRRYLEIIGL